MRKPEPIKTMQVDQLPVAVYASSEDLGLAAALDTREIINAAIAERGEANIILAGGNSQLTYWHALRELDGIGWSKVNVFHMDEYLGIDPDHKARISRFLREQLLDFVEPRSFHPVPAQPADAEAACREYEALLRQHPADLVGLGWGENGHMAFNDPPFADFDDPAWVKVVKLAEESKRQVTGEGHFASVDEVPDQAITLTIPALLAPRHVLAVVPEARKADAVHACLREPIDEARPGSILRRTPHARLYLDRDSLDQ